MAVPITNLDRIRLQNPVVWEALISIQRALTEQSIDPPPQVTSLNVSAADGIFQASMADSGPVKKGVNYFLEYDTDPNFTQPHVIHLGTSRTWRGSLGNLTLNFRAYSQYAVIGNSNPNTPVVFQGAVVGGGDNGPDLMPSTGSGTASPLGTQGASGFGKTPVRPV